ncbi:hypothetical protein BDY21DRAFT_367854 [Lineolata rhizophorae]|uniref:Uncharacterized protein n=1 Tax=Lineolata rhizophorae TaxID=578093 RepID=A0A6A6NKU7_9PEZI|nr:hypothetical protein BDY21DRAFT_367854 [Lineolata rhizophorae]
MEKAKYSFNWYTTGLSECYKAFKGKTVKIRLEYPFLAQLKALNDITEVEDVDLRVKIGVLDIRRRDLGQNIIKRLNVIEIDLKYLFNPRRYKFRDIERKAMAFLWYQYFTRKRLDKISFLPWQQAKINGDGITLTDLAPTQPLALEEWPIPRALSIEYVRSIGVQSTE